jgi:hypothetical protein
MTVSDDKTKRRNPERNFINMRDEYELKYWIKHLGVSREKLQHAVDKVGDSASAVRKELGKTPLRQSRSGPRADPSESIAG